MQCCALHPQGVAPDNEDEPPALWAIEALAAPIGLKLRFHFARGRATDRPDRPEYLFETALRVVSSVAPGLSPLGEALAVHDLQHAYHVPFELARAVRGEVQVHSYQLAGNTCSHLNDLFDMCAAVDCGYVLPANLHSGVLAKYPVWTSPKSISASCQVLRHWCMGHSRSVG